MWLAQFTKYSFDKLLTFLVLFHLLPDSLVEHKVQILLILAFAELVLFVQGFLKISYVVFCQLVALTGVCFVNLFGHLENEQILLMDVHYSGSELVHQRVDQF